MKNLFVLAFLMLGLFSCQDSMIVTDEVETKDEVDLPQDLQDILGGIQTRNDFPLSSFELAEYLNTFDFTPPNYEGCETELLSVAYGPIDTDGESGDPLSEIVADATYSAEDFGKILTELWSRLSDECQGNYVIVGANFYSLFLEEPFISQLGVNLEICCSPIFEPTDPNPGPKNDTPKHGKG